MARMPAPPKLDLPALPPASFFSRDNTRNVFNDVRAISVHEEVIVENLHEQALVTEGYAIKAKLGATLTQEVNVQAAQEFQKVREAIMEIEEVSASFPYHDLQQQFDLHILQLTARSLANVATVTNTNIGQEVNRSPQPTPDQQDRLQPHRSIKQRLFG